jgi:REP element-mobilizing transposase RayT
LTDTDRSHFLTLLDREMQQHEVVLHAYVLMDNHYHLIVRTQHPNLSRFMHGVNTAYTVWFNLKHARTGHLFEGRYKAIAMEEVEYLLTVSGYVHLNPVRVHGWRDRPVAERLQRIIEYPWSSYRHYAKGRGQSSGPCVSCDSVWGDLAAQSVRQGCQRYRAYIENWLKADAERNSRHHAAISDSHTPFAAVQRGSYLGCGEFGEMIERMLTGDRPLTEQVVGYRQWRRNAPIEDVLAAAMHVVQVDWPVIARGARPNRPRRDEIMWLMRMAADRNLGEIGLLMGVKQAAVSLATKRVADRMTAEEPMRRRMQDARDAVIKIVKT